MNTIINVGILCKAEMDSGNFSTGQRIANFLNEESWINCKIIRLKKGSLNLLENGNSNVNWDIIIGIHLLRCYPYLGNYNKPFIIICGGTDINEDYKNEINAIKMREILQLSKYCVVFSNIMKFNLEHNVFMNHSFPCYIIPQSVEPQKQLLPSSFSVDFIKYVKKNRLIAANEESFFVVVGRIRAVKNCISIIKPFTEWNAKRLNKYFLIFIGSVEDNEYGENFKNLLSTSPHVYHMSGIEKSLVQSAIVQSRCLINCSHSEGQSLAILEAMNLGVPVLVRNISGNMAIVEHLVTGFVYSNDKEFQQYLSLIDENHDVIQTIKVAAQKRIVTQHSCEAEKSAYINLIRHIVHDCHESSVTR